MSIDERIAALREVEIPALRNLHIPEPLLGLLKLGLVDIGFNWRIRAAEDIVRWYDDVTEALGEPVVSALADHYSMSEIEAISSIVSMYRVDHAIEEWKRMERLAEFFPRRAAANRHARRKLAKTMKGRS